MVWLNSGQCSFLLVNILSEQGLLGRLQAAAFLKGKFIIQEQDFSYSDFNENEQRTTQPT